MTNNGALTTSDSVTHRREGRPLRRSGYAVAAVGVAAVIAAGCGSSSSSTATPAASATTPATSPASSSAAPTSAAANAITATLTEFKIVLSRTPVTPGSYTFDAVNSGHTVHALEITGPGVTDQKTTFLQPGKSADLTVTLTAGTYDVFCPVGDHKQLGMNLSLTVDGTGTASAGAASTVAPATTSSPATTTASGGGSGY